MEGFCRGCLIKYDDPNELLEYTEKNRRLFIYSTGLQVKRNDTFTFQLCKDCYLNMKQSCKFKKLCRTSDKKFRTYLSLKEAGDNIDLCTYLKNNDDNFMLRFPHWAGSSTPTNQKKDDDNESTCTSIGNFMRDILQGTEMPDSEARIIRQVIEEEADVLDESLDSHWLQDDMSIDTNFQLDFSFSPFSTPRSVSNDHCYTPRRQAEQDKHYGLPKVMSNKPANQSKTDENEDDEKPIEIKEYDIFSDSLLDKIGDQNYGTRVNTENYDEKEIEKIENDLIVEEVDALSDNQINQVNSKNYYVDNTLIEQTVNDVARILGKNVDESPTGVILNDKNIRETQKAVASLFDGKGHKNQSDSVNIFDGKSGKNQKLVEMDGTGISETQRAVASLFDGKGGKYQTDIASTFGGKDIVSKTQTFVSIYDGKTGKNQAEVINIFDDNSGRNPKEISTIFGGKTVNETAVVNGKSGKNQSIFGKAVRENQNYGHNFKGKGGNNKKIISFYDGKVCEKETTAAASVLDAVNTAKQNDECAIQRELDEALKDESQQITLEDLLGSPTAYPNTAASTPTIHNIIFGEKLDDDSNQKVERTIEKFHDLHGQLDELFNDVEVKEEPISPSPTAQPEDISKTLTINVAENLNINVSYNLPHGRSTKNKKPLPEQDYEGIELVDCVCTICDKEFKDMRILKLHFAKKHKVKLPRAKRKPEAAKVRICDYCGKKDIDKRNFLRHMNTHNEPENIRCEKCGVKFRTKAKYNKHWKTHLGHNPIHQAGEKVCCDICGREVLRKSIYKHRRIHQKQFLGHCEDCGKGYYTPADYRAHKLEHTGERPFACEVCAARFIRKSALVRHMRTHMGEKRFACDNCNKRYSQKVSLINHIATGCCRDFKETGKLRSRKQPIRAKNTIKVFKIMTEEELARKPFECVYCHTRHRSENVLIRHQKISKACKEIQCKEGAPTVIEVLYDRVDPSAQSQPVDLSCLKS